MRKLQYDKSVQLANFPGRDLLSSWVDPRSLIPLPRPKPIENSPGFSCGQPIGKPLQIS
jgi:hypothetical protein